MSSGNQTMVVCVRVVGSQNPWSFLQSKRNLWYNLVSSFKSRVKCTFLSSTFRSNTFISWCLEFFVFALHFDELFSPTWGIQNFYRVNQIINFRVHRNKGIFHPAVCGIDVNQVVLGVLSVEKFKNLQVFFLISLFVKVFRRFNSSSQIYFYFWMLLWEFDS